MYISLSIYLSIYILTFCLVALIQSNLVLSFLVSILSLSTVDMISKFRHQRRRRRFLVQFEVLEDFGLLNHLKLSLKVALPNGLGWFEQEIYTGGGTKVSQKHESKRVEKCKNDMFGWIWPFPEYQSASCHAAGRKERQKECLPTGIGEFGLQTTCFIM